MTINIDPTAAAWICSVVAAVCLVLVVNAPIEAKKQKSRRDRADDMLDKSQQSQERNAALMERQEAILSRTLLSAYLLLWVPRLKPKGEPNA